MQSITVHVNPPYKIIIRNKGLGLAGEALAPLQPQGRIAVLSDSTVAALHYPALEASLKAAGYAPRLMAFPAGEASKTLETCAAVLDFLAGNHFTRSDLLIALGGGVTGDLGGFAAAIYLRGIRFVQIPTTLLAMVDSSVGGKTGVDLPSGKNLAGAFHQPSLVLCDPELTATLPSETLAAGCAEAIKTGLLGDAALFAMLSRSDWRGHLAEVIARAVALKAKIVEADEFDRGERQKLNLGHTLAHAIEKATGYAVAHGQAVAMGMAAVTRAAVAKGVASAEVLEALLVTLRLHGLPTELPRPVGELLPYIASDKKRAGDRLTLVVPEAIGACRLMPMPLDEACNFLAIGK